MPLARLPLLFALFPLASTASVLPTHAHGSRSVIPETWFHPSDHPIYTLFRRETQAELDTPTTGVVFLLSETPRAYSPCFLISYSLCGPISTTTRPGGPC